MSVARYLQPLLYGAGACAVAALFVPSAISGAVVALLLGVLLVLAAIVACCGGAPRISLHPAMIASVALLLSVYLASALHGQQWSTRVLFGTTLEWGSIAAAVLVLVGIVLGMYAGAVLRSRFTYFLEAGALLYTIAMLADGLGITQLYALSIASSSAAFFLAAAIVSASLAIDMHPTAGRPFHAIVVVGAGVGLIALAAHDVILIGSCVAIASGVALWLLEKRVAYATAIASALLLGGFFFGARAPLIAVSPDVRPAYVTTAWVLGAAYQNTPANVLVGYGPNSFPLAWDYYRPIEMNATPLWSFTPQNAYSTAMQMLVEVGLLGAFSFALLFGAALFTGLQRRVDLRILAFVLLCGIGSAFLNISMPLLLLAALGIGMCYASDRAEPLPLSRATRCALGALGIGLGVAFVSVAYLQLYAAYYAEEASAHASDLWQSAEYMKKAAETWGVAQYRKSAALAFAEKVRLAAPYARSTPLLTTIYSDYALASNYASLVVRDEPKDFTAWITRATVYEEFLRLKVAPLSEETAQSFTQAGYLSSTRPDLPLLQARLALDVGDTESARTFVQQALSLKPDYPEALNFLRAIQSGQ